jgi:AbrB family looped-hinge helix DNA binding protein
MLAELRAKSQITIPKEIVEAVGISEGDMLEVQVRDGCICLVPVVVCPKSLIGELRVEVKEAREMLASGQLPEFGGMEALISRLGDK